MLKVLLLGPFSTFSGYGNDLIGIARALMRNPNVDLYIHPNHLDPPLPEDIAMLLTKPLEAPFDLLIQHVDPATLEISQQQRRAATVTVAWSMWEWSSLDNLKGKSTLRKRLKNFDLFLGYDQNTVNGFRSLLPKKANIDILQGGFWPEDWEYMERDWHSERFGFCMVGQLHQRKDPFVAIQAFKELKDEYPEEFEPAELHLKTNILGLHPLLEEWCPKLRIHYAAWPYEILKEFYRKQHVLLAPSRGEGKNMPALEFQSTGGGVIATNWGGHTGWLNEDFNYPLDYILQPLNPGYPNCLEARASKDHLKELMLHTFRNREEVFTKGLIASKFIPSTKSWDSVIDRLFIKVRDLVPETGQIIYNKAVNLEG